MPASQRFKPLPAGNHGLGRDAVRADQARRLREAMIELIAAKGYAAVRIAELTRLAHVSPPTLYSLYADKQQLLLDTYDDVAQRTAAVIWSAHGEHDGDPARQRLLGVLAAFASLAAREPAAISLLVLGAFGGGPPMLSKRRAALDALEAYVQSNRAPGTPLDSGDLTVSALIGGVREVTATRLRAGREAELPALVEELIAWAGCYPVSLPAGLAAPPLATSEAARLSPGRSRAHGPLPSGRSDLPREAIVKSQQERIVDATAAIVAERGLAALTIPAIVKRANVSNETFYSCYASKHDAFVGAQKVGMHQALRVTADAYGSGRDDWPRAIVAGIGALLGYLASEPAHAHLAIVDTFGASPEAVAIRDDAIAAFRSYLAPGVRHATGAGELAAEAVVGAVWQVLHDYVARGAATALPAIAPQLSYFALAPFVGAQQAVAAALASAT